METSKPASDRRISDRQAIFLVWSAPTQGSSRSRLLAKELGMGSPYYVYSSMRRGRLSAPLRYVLQWFNTLQLLFQKRPRMVLVQNPPSFAVLCTALYAKLTGSRYIIDAHSDAFQRGVWNRPSWLYHRVARRATATLVTDDHFREMVEGWGAKALVVRDPVTEYPLGTYPLSSHFNVTVVNTFAFDEPLREILRAAKNLPSINFYVTGRIKPDHQELLEMAPANVTFTDFLPEDEFYGLLRASHAVMSLTTRNHTLQCGACEALSLERPVITSHWPLLKDYFSLGTVHVDNTAEGIRRGIEEMCSNYERYQWEIVRLRKIRHEEWQTLTAMLANMITG